MAEFEENVSLGINIGHATGDYVQSGEPFIRPYQPETDYEAVVEICKATADASYAPALELVPYIYAIPYILLSPANTFILDSGAGIAVGYILGTPDTRDFVSRYRSAYLPNTVLPAAPASPPCELRKTLEETCNRPEDMLREFVGAFPAHLHIDILPSHQGKGWGTALMGEFLRRLRAEGVNGVHLGVGKENGGAMRFYGRCGFAAMEGMGEGEGAVWMARVLGGE